MSWQKLRLSQLRRERLSQADKDESLGLPRNSTTTIQKACPWCKNKKVRVFQRSAPFRCTCTNPKCNVKGPVANTKAGCIEAWNGGMAIDQAADILDER